MGKRTQDPSGAPDVASELVEVQPAVPRAAGEVDPETRYRLRHALRILLAARRRDEDGRGPSGG